MVFDGIIQGRSEHSLYSGKVSIDVKLTEEGSFCQSFSVRIEKGSELDLAIGTKVQIGIQQKPDTFFSTAKRVLTGGN